MKRFLASLEMTTGVCVTAVKRFLASLEMTAGVRVSAVKRFLASLEMTTGVRVSIRRSAAQQGAASEKSFPCVGDEKISRFARNDNGYACVNSKERRSTKRRSAERRCMARQQKFLEAHKMRLP
jgi:hypothetical protein